MLFSLPSSVRRLAFLALCGTLASALTAQAAPTEQQKQEARRLMAQGDEQFRARNFPAAFAAYRAAHDIMRLPTTGLEVARTLGAIGRWVESRKAAEEVQNSARLAAEPAAFSAARQEAQRMVAELDARIPRLHLRVSGIEPGISPRLTLDSSDTLLMADVPVSVNPGWHLVFARAPGRAPREVKVEAREGQTHEVLIAFEPLAGNSAVPPTAPAAVGAIPPSPSAPPLTRVPGLSTNRDPFLLDDCEHEGWSTLPHQPWGTSYWHLFSAEGSELIPPASTVSFDRARLQAAETTASLMQPLGGERVGRAAHVSGIVRGAPVAWASLQLLIRQDAAPVDLGGFEGVEFDARSDLGTRVKFKVAEARTAAAQRQCTRCDNYHSAGVLPLPAQWAHYVYLFSDLQQEVGWGEPVGPIDPRKVVHVEWLASAGPLDLWVDNIRLIPKGAAPSKPSTAPATLVPTATAGRSGSCAGCRIGAREGHPSGTGGVAVLGGAALLALGRRCRRTRRLDPAR